MVGIVGKDSQNLLSGQHGGSFLITQDPLFLNVMAGDDLAYQFSISLSLRARESLLKLP